MRIVTLIENTPGDPRCACEHGLSLYLETHDHRLLMDTGSTGAFADNAEALGIDLTRVDTVVLSHGHYDHAGGLLRFAALNPGAPIYLQAGPTAISTTATATSASTRPSRRCPRSARSGAICASTGSSFCSRASPAGGSGPRAISHSGSGGTVRPCRTISPTSSAWWSARTDTGCWCRAAPTTAS